MSFFLFVFLYFRVPIRVALADTFSWLGNVSRLDITVGEVRGGYLDYALFWILLRPRFPPAPLIDHRIYLPIHTIGLKSVPRKVAVPFKFMTLMLARG